MQAKPHHHSKRVLFLLKEHSYGNYSIVKSGLLNSVKLLIKALAYFHLVKEAKVSVCLDANSIDREVFLFRPDICFIEAIWVTGKKLAEIKRLHPKTIFIIRVHSNIPFLALEGDAIERLNEYKNINGVFISFNNEKTTNDFGWLYNPIYLPNVYFTEDDTKTLGNGDGNGVNVGCFGSIRPFKNQLIQAVAAINFGNENNKTIYFHINSGRIEQRGETVLKNLRNLFIGSGHYLVEHNWMDHEQFLLLVNKMDIGLQVSFSESFNIVTADFVHQKIPIVVSKDISWMPKGLKVEATDAKEIELKIKEVLTHKKVFIKKQTHALEEYNTSAIDVWDRFLR